MATRKTIPPTMHSVEHMSTNRIRLRNFRPSDAPALVRHLRDIEVTRYTFIPHPYKAADARKFLNRAARLRRLGRGVIFVIEGRATGELIGAIGIMRIDWANSRAEFGYWVAKSHWGKGIASESVRLFVPFAFDVLGLYRLYANVFGPNLASQKVLLNCGFTREGVLRQSELHRGHRLDNHIFSLLRSEYRAAKRRQKQR